MVARLLPAHVRKTIYSVLGTLWALEAIFDVVPAGWESKALQALAVLGFGMAVAHTTDRG